jgi:hypothetical protein
MLLTIGVVSVSLLLGIKFVLDSYYLDMTESYEKELLPKTTLLDETRAQQRAALDKGENGDIPVSVAMQTIAKGRDNASPIITPEPSEDVDPLKGWAQLPHALHLPPQVATTTVPFAPMDGGVGDAGAPTMMKDGGAMMNATMDAGAHHAPLAPSDAGVHAAPRVPPQAPPQNAKDGGA